MSQKDCGKHVGFTGERLVPGVTPEAIFRSHLMRYKFAAAFAQRGRVIDVASGTGLGTDLLQRSGASECIGVDNDGISTQMAKEAFPACRFILADASKLSLRNDVADCVVAFEVLEHVRDPEALILECKRVLRPEGVCIVSTPNKRFYRWLGKNPFHVREFEDDEFRMLMRRHFERIEFFGQHETNYPGLVVRRTVVAILARMGLKDPLKRTLRPHGSEDNGDTVFDGDRNYGEAGVLPLHRRRAHGPMVLLAVARKSA